MSELLKVQGHTHLRKDPSSGGIVNIDKVAYKNHLLAKSIAQRSAAEKKIAQESISTMQTEINNIKDDILEIKSLIIKLINKDT